MSTGTSPTDPVRPPIAPSQVDHSIVPTQDQVVVLYVIAVYMVIIFGVWNIPGARILINPLKLLTIGFHELCHVVAALLTGGTILRVTIDPNVGGVTLVEGGWPTVILAAGYVGSAVIGAVLSLAGWDTLVAKIMSWFVAVGLVAPLWFVRDKITIILTICYEALLIGFWFVDHGGALRFYCLFVAVMNVFYVIWDFADDRFFRKLNDSDATQWQILYPRIGAHIWAVLWIMFATGTLIGFLFVGIVCFKRTQAEMVAEAAKFLPT